MVLWDKTKLQSSTTQLNRQWIVKEIIQQQIWQEWIDQWVATVWIRKPTDRWAALHKWFTQANTKWWSIETSLEATLVQAITLPHNNNAKLYQLQQDITESMYQLLQFKVVLPIRGRQVRDIKHRTTLQLHSI
jgi:hypothetical protein